MRLIICLALLLLSACRMPVEVDGRGFVFGQSDGGIYRQGYLFEIEQDFHEVFWPVPAPGYAFEGWTDICSDRYDQCELQLAESLWSQDDEYPLGVRYTPDYTGPLALRYYEQYWNPTRGTLDVPVDSVQLEGSHPDEPPRLFMATPNLEVIVPARRVGRNYKFRLPLSAYSPDDFWLFVSGTDTNGVIASASIDFGLAEKVQKGKLRPLNNRSPWADVLVGCASANDAFNLCSLEVLPFLGSVTDRPGISDILHRTVVSHVWMGKRFAEVLRRLPPEMLKLFRGITAVVIAADIRPSFYTPATGTIYIDPQDLWLNQRERNSINWEPDYRLDFSVGLNFIPISLYVSGNRPAWFPGFSYPRGATRQLDDIIWPVANLLTHELAHANDAVPPALLGQARAGETPLDLAFRLEFSSPTFKLAYNYPLRSELLYELGDVLYRGSPADEIILSLTAADVGFEFEADDANALYSYSTPYEDTAMLVEEVLTGHYFGLERIVSFLDVPAGEEPDCTDYTLRWGARNRAATPGVRERARLVLTDILDEPDVTRYLASVPDPAPLTRAIGLCEGPVDRATAGLFLAPQAWSAHRAARVRSHDQPQRRGHRR